MRKIKHSKSIWSTFRVTHHLKSQQKVVESTFLSLFPRAESPQDWRKLTMKVKFIFCRQPFEGSRRDPAADSITYRRRRRRQWQIKTQIFRTNEPLTQSKNQSLLLLKIEPYLSKDFFLNRLSFRSFSRKSSCYSYSAVSNKRKWNFISF